MAGLNRVQIARRALSSFHGDKLHLSAIKKILIKAGVGTSEKSMKEYLRALDMAGVIVEAEHLVFEINCND